MTEERITETETPNGNTHTHTTVVTEGEKSSGGSKWFIAIALVIIAVLGLFAFNQMGSAEIAKDEAVAEAADNIGEAAGQVGNAAENVGEAAQDAAENLDN